MKKQLKQIENQAQQGRSMVEMLGVLAVIGVLSLGGIVGYRLAMNYYQASQIAHEMNLMRTDAQIKVAQGAEELTLGSPYDTGTIRFNDYPTDFGFTNSIATPENPEEETEEDYYIEVSAIPQGVCNPLATLLNGMDGKTALKVNGSDYDTAVNLCNLEENRLSVSFAAENINDESFAEGWCENDDDCGGGYCQNHICVECKESNDCGEFEVCDQQEGKCTTDCSKGGCQEDLKCDSQTNRCVECRNIDDCSGGLACKNNQCATCSSEADCEGKHCTDMGTCVECTGRESIWDANKKECVECNASHQCPNGKVCQDGVCGACTTDSQCASNNCQDGACKNCATSADCRDNRACENGICYDSCVDHESGCENGTHCDSNTQKCVSNCQSSKECDDLQVCNEETGVCEEDCTAAGAMNCKNGSHCNETSKQCVKDCTPEDCSGETPICNTSTGVCEACTADSQCGEGKHCDTSTGKATSGTCVQCRTNTDCSGTTPICTAGVCGKCTADSQCGTGNHCKTDGSCVTCSGSTPYWNTSTKQCEACPTSTPYWNGSVCKTCASVNSSKPAWNATKKQCDTCYNVNSVKPYWEGSQCMECPSGTKWNTQTNACEDVGCTSNTQCGAGQYCYFHSSESCSTQTGYTGGCRSNTPTGMVAVNGKTFIAQNKDMSWWSAQNFCKSHNKSMASVSDLNCADEIVKGKTGYCQSSTVTALEGKFGNTLGNNVYWLYDMCDSSCSAYYVYPGNGAVSYFTRNNDLYALCVDK